MSGKKKGLGRGLSALYLVMKNLKINQKINQSNTVSISDLSRNPYQPRQHFSEEKLEELANSIKKMVLFSLLLFDQIKLKMENMKSLLEKEDGLQLKELDFMKYQLQF